MPKAFTLLFLVVVAGACGPGAGATVDDAGTSYDGASLDAADTSVDAAPNAPDSSDASEATDSSDASVSDASTQACGNAVACRDGETCQGGACVYGACVGQHVPGDYPTLAAALSALAQVGGTICLGSSTYVETPSTYAVTAPLTIQGVSSQDTLVEIGSALVLSASANLTIAGVGITGAMTSAVTSAVQVATAPLATATFVNCSITANVHASRALELDEGTYVVRATTIVGGGNTNYVGLYAQAATATIDSDDVSASNGQAILSQGASTLTIVNSYLHDSSYGALLSGAGVVVENNTFTHDGTAILFEQNTSTKYFNNVFYDSGVAVSLIFGTTPTSGNNLFFGNTTNFGNSAVDGTMDVQSDPLLDTSTPPAPSLGSPAIASGSVANAPAMDYWGASRSGGADIGCVQHL